MVGPENTAGRAQGYHPFIREEDRCSRIASATSSRCTTTSGGASIPIRTSPRRRKPTTFTLIVISPTWISMTSFFRLDKISIFSSMKIRLTTRTLTYRITPVKRYFQKLRKQFGERCLHCAGDPLRDGDARLPVAAQNPIERDVRHAGAASQFTLRDCARRSQVPVHFAAKFFNGYC